MDRLQTLDMSSPESIQELMEGGGQSMTGPPSSELQAATGRLEVLLALASGYAMVLAERVLDGRLPALASIQEAVRRRLAEEDSAPILFATLLRADPERAAAARGERFCHEVLAATDVEGLDRIWAHPDYLPTAEELVVPGRWLERVGLVGGEEISLDEGLQALLGGEEEGKSAPPDEDEGGPAARGGGPDEPREPGPSGP
jgi:uncharacterized protein (DUF2342 family)